MDTERTPLSARESVSEPSPRTVSLAPAGRVRTQCDFVSLPPWLEAGCPEATAASVSRRRGERSGDAACGPGTADILFSACRYPRFLPPRMTVRASPGRPSSLILATGAAPRSCLVGLIPAFGQVFGLQSRRHGPAFPWSWRPSASCWGGGLGETPISRGSYASISPPPISNPLAATRDQRPYDPVLGQPLNSLRRLTQVLTGPACRCC